MSFLYKYVSGFRMGHDCRVVLIRFSESAKSQLDNNNVAAAVLTDHQRLLIVYHMICYSVNFTFCGLNESACKLVTNDFMDRY